ncbi:MAG: TonB family protein [Neomegalonema sp.]|nr:TonB family protein [Neomegalonema sp.]
MMARFDFWASLGAAVALLAAAFASTPPAEGSLGSEGTGLAGERRVASVDAAAVAAAWSGGAKSAQSADKPAPQPKRAEPTPKPIKSAPTKSSAEKAAAPRPAPARPAEIAARQSATPKKTALSRPPPPPATKRLTKPTPPRATKSAPTAKRKVAPKRQKTRRKAAKQRKARRPRKNAKRAKKRQPSRPAPSAAAAAASVAKKADAGASDGVTRTKGAQKAAAEARWRARLARRIDRRKQYPSASRRRGERGVVIIMLTVSKGGALIGSNVRRSSGYGRLDSAALAAVRRAAPFPPAPKSMTAARKSFSVKIVFQ